MSARTAATAVATRVVGVGLVLLVTPDAHASPLEPYLDALDRQGMEPVAFVAHALDDHDLILFDDALHTAVEPWELYAELVRSPEIQAHHPTIYLELVPVSEQLHLDAYLDSTPEDRSLLHPVFQDATTFGFPYQTYLDFLHEVHAVNATLPEGRRFRVVGVSSPTYWTEIHSPDELALYRASLLGRDYQMYRHIADDLDDLDGGRKGLFLTNTRHAYAGVRKGDGRFFWNTGTFFRTEHPGKTLSVRLHGPALHIEAAREVDPGEATTQGLERRVYRWGRMGDGRWDDAFASHGARPVAVPLAGTPFGADRYVGNHMLTSHPDMTLADAYDAVIFLAPLESWRQTAFTDAIHTPAFRAELARRYREFLTPEELDRRLAKAEVSSVEAYVELAIAAAPEEPLPQAQDLDREGD